MSAGMVDNYQAAPFQHPHRKPLPPGIVAPNIRRSAPEQQQYPTASQLPPQSQPPSSYHPPSNSRPNSAAVPQTSSTVAYGQVPQNTNPVSYQAHMNQYNPSTRRTLSNATASTSSTGGAARVTSSSSSNLQRSTSSRSGNAPTSYVALMRKQKATVWCDRAQQEDPRLLAQQRAAKMRATMEVSNANAAGRTSTSGSSLTGGVRSKIRHHGAPKAQQYTPTTHPAHGVPVRLSANEVDEDESDDDGSYQGKYHQRSGSGRSSLGSVNGRMASMYMAQQSAAPGLSTDNSTPSSGNAHSPAAPEETPIPGQPVRGPDYFNVRKTEGAGNSAATPRSGSSDREMSFGGVGGLPQRLKVPGDDEAKKLDLADLRRRGSVDDRTMTMSGYGRLFVANPDVD